MDNENNNLYRCHKETYSLGHHHSDVELLTFNYKVWNSRKEGDSLAGSDELLMIYHRYC